MSQGLLLERPRDTRAQRAPRNCSSSPARDGRGPVCDTTGSPRRLMGYSEGARRGGTIPSRSKHDRVVLLLLPSAERRRLVRRASARAGTGKTAPAFGPQCHFQEDAVPKLRRLAAPLREASSLSGAGTAQRWSAGFCPEPDLAVALPIAAETETRWQEETIPPGSRGADALPRGDKRLAIEQRLCWQKSGETLRFPSPLSAAG